MTLPPVPSSNRSRLRAYFRSILFSFSMTPWSIGWIEDVTFGGRYITWKPRSSEFKALADGCDGALSKKSSTLPILL